MSIRILVVDHHPLVREGCRSLLARQPDMEVVAEVKDGQTAVRLARELAPDVVLMDIAISGLNGPEATRQIKAAVPGVKVVTLSMYADRQFVQSMLEAGASGYLLKQSIFCELAQAIREVVADRIYLSPRIAGSVPEDSVPPFLTHLPPGAAENQRKGPTINKGDLF